MTTGSVKAKFGVGERERLMGSELGENTDISSHCWDPTSPGLTPSIGILDEALDESNF